MHTTSLRISLLCTGLLVGTTIGVACTTQVKNDRHCFYNDGNATCAERYGELAQPLPYCGTVCLGQDGMEPSPNGDGCVDFVPEDGCYSPCGGKDITEDDSCLGVADTGSTDVSVGTEPTGTSATDATEGPSTTVTTVSGSETEPTTSGPVGCVESSECTDASAPLCLNELCVACTESDNPNSSCAEKDPGLGVCGNDGACVECTASEAGACGGMTPVCDEGTSACVGCEAHEECGGAACAFATGECLDACVLEVDGDGGGDAMTVNEAVGMVGDGEACTIVVHEWSANEYGTVTIDGGKVIGLLAADGESPVIQGSGGAGIELSGGAVLYADRLQLRLSGGGGLGLTLSGGETEAWVDACQIAENTGGGITVTGGAELHLRNSMVGANGNGAPNARGLTIADSTAVITYSSIVRNDASANDSLLCNAASDVTVRNSILVGRDPSSISCDSGELSSNAIDEAVAGNTNVGALVDEWFTDVFAGELFLSPAGADVFAEIAQWQSGDPMTDFEGEPRPTRDGAADYAGADVP